MWKKALGAHVTKILVVPIIIGMIMSAYPYILSLQVESMTWLGGRRVLVVGTVEYARDSQGWANPDHFEWFDEWWQTDGPSTVLAESRGVFTLLSISWTIIEEKADSDVLRFVAVLQVNPSTVKNWVK